MPPTACDIQICRRWYPYRWTILSTDTEEAKRTVMVFLKTIDGLESFALVDNSYSHAHYVSLDVSSNLRKLSVTVARNLTLGTREYYPTALQWTCMVVGKSPRLEQLVPQSPYAWPEICPILMSAGIQLKQISDVYISEELLVYLSSYSGLENLTIGSERDKEDLAHLFFSCLLPHKHYLLSLLFFACQEGEWCLTPYNLRMISRFHALQRLEMNVNSYDTENIITSFLELTPDMPALRTICLRSTPTEIPIFGVCGRNRRTALRHEQMRIDNALNKYSDSTDSASVRKLIETHRELILPSTY
ncbi:hypothetical protein B0H19DRAFT_578726 [Mycena capillaripes]|nr:hypothetical protein B0H19DRAFT_578726 [Mycena capillaripes]